MGGIAKFLGHALMLVDRFHPIKHLSQTLPDWPNETPLRRVFFCYTRDQRAAPSTRTTLRHWYLYPPAFSSDTCSTHSRSDVTLLTINVMIFGSCAL